MPSPAPETLALARHYRLALADLPTHGPAGERLGKGAGASLEFQDRRAYVPGDDVRHLDWSAYARTDQVMVRLYREEVLPLVEIVVDGSRSMAVEERKAALATDLAALLSASARAGGYHVRLVLAADEAQLIEVERLEREGLEFEGVLDLPRSVEGSLALLRPGAIRILVSDFLSPHDPARLVRSFAAAAGGLALVQVLGVEDAQPPADSALRLTDAESGEHLDLVLDRRTVEGYRERLARLAAGLADEARRASGVFVTLASDRPLQELCRAELAAGGVLRPA